MRDFGKGLSVLASRLIETAYNCRASVSDATQLCHPSEVEGPVNCGMRHTSRRGPSTEFILSKAEGLRMTPPGVGTSRVNSTIL
jgi:hypothetical protein